ncbi:transposase [Amycolatopsis sp. NPDC051071]|uniref:transposase n=1 Tax=Amycolatopsis sp. NPDC051071 TaxID=3154637 RepID=UPI003429C681
MPVSPICRCLSCPAHGESLTSPPLCPFYPSSSMTDAQWVILAPLPPPPGNNTDKGGRPEKHPRRLVLDAIFYLSRGGIAWRQMPNDFPPAMTIYDTGRPQRQQHHASLPRQRHPRIDHRLPRASHHLRL